MNIKKRMMIYLQVLLMIGLFGVSMLSEAEDQSNLSNKIEEKNLVLRQHISNIKLD
jgi:Tfp pilus assembly protein PilX